MSFLVTAVCALAVPHTVLAYTLYLSPTGNDSNSGLSPPQALATLSRANELLLAANPNAAVFVRVAEGTYHCQNTLWTYHNPSFPTTIEPLNTVPTPAVETFNHPNRPVFIGKKADGTQCDVGSIWLSILHGHVRMRLTIRGMTATYYRGGIAISNYHDTTTMVDQEIVINNMLFERIGDYYYPGHGGGRGAILASTTFGNTIRNSYFRYIKDSNDQLIHAIYFSGLASRNLIDNNHFHSVSSSAIQNSNYSNNNVFTNNGFSWIYGYAFRDRWCGIAGDDIDEDCGGEPDCPSWNIYFPIENNAFSNVEGRIKTYPIPAGQTCARSPAASNLRIDLGSEGTYFGDDGVTLP